MSEESMEERRRVDDLYHDELLAYFKELKSLVKEVHQNQENVVMPDLKMLKEKVIIGNGKPPLCQTVAIIEEKIAVIERDKTEAPKNINMWLVFGLQTITIIIAAASFVVRK